MEDGKKDLVELTQEPLDVGAISSVVYKGSMEIPDMVLNLSLRSLNRDRIEDKVVLTQSFLDLLLIKYPYQNVS